MGLLTLLQRVKVHAGHVKLSDSLLSPILERSGCGVFASSGGGDARMRVYTDICACVV